MINRIKAAIFRYSEMSWPHLTLLKAWLMRSASFNNFDGESFAAPSLRVAVATDENNEPIVFCPVEKVLMVSCYAVSPTVSPDEAQRAGDMLDATIAHAAQQQGIAKLLIVIPKGQQLPKGEWEEVRSYTRKIPQPVAMHGVDYSTSSQATHFIN